MSREKARAIRLRTSELYYSRPAECDCSASRDAGQVFHDDACTLRTWFAECRRRAENEAIAA